MDNNFKPFVLEPVSISSLRPVYTGNLNYSSSHNHGSGKFGKLHHCKGNDRLGGTTILY